MTRAYLYKWTEKTTGKWYIGSRSRKGCHPNDGYICSSKVVKPMIKECPDNWIREVLVIGHPKYIVELEANYLKALDAKNDCMSYNQCNGFGDIINDRRVNQFGDNNVMRNPEIAAKVSANKTGRKRPDLVSGKGWNSPEASRKKSIYHKGKKHSLEHIENYKKTIASKPKIKCEHCGLETNNKGNLLQHIRARHSVATRSQNKTYGDNA